MQKLYYPKKNRFCLIFIVLIILTQPINIKAIIIQPITKHWLSLDWPLYNLQISPTKNYIAFTDTDDGIGLNVININKKIIIKISNHFVGNVFYWAPDNCRLFFRELTKNEQNKIQTNLMSYDCTKDTTIILKKYPYETGYLALHPKDLRLNLLYPQGIHISKLILPQDQRNKINHSYKKLKKWAISNNSVIFIQNNKIAKKINDNNEKITSFDISKNDHKLVWATANNKIYYSTDGNKAYFLDEGKDPKWHPSKDLIIYTSPRKIVNKMIAYDLKISDLKGNKKFLTKTYNVEERWPNWSKNGTEIIYTVYKSTDLFKITFKNY